MQILHYTLLANYANADFAQHVKNKKNTQIYAKNTQKETII